MVRTNTRVGPGSGDAAVVRVKGTKRALALATDGNGRWGFLSPRIGAMDSVIEAARNVACSGALPIAATNCLNFGNPEKPEVMWQFAEAIDGIAEACTALEIPITGGNVSFYNETLGNAIYPTPVLGVLGLIEDVDNALGSGFRQEGDLIFLLDAAAIPESASLSTPESREIQRREFSSSEYAKTIHGIVAGEPPAIDLPAEKRLIGCMVKLAADKAIVSAHDVSDGGIAVAIAESCFAADGLSADVDLKGKNEPTEAALFGERGARAVVSASASSIAHVNGIAAQCGVQVIQIGAVTRGEFRIQQNGATAIHGTLDSFRQVWSESLKRAVES